MDTTRIDVHAPARQVAATLALAQLEHSLSAASRLGDGDPESLHDMRVSIKRLRTLLKAYGDDLGKSVNKPRQALGKLMDASNPGRDAEVQRDWLRAQDEGVLDLSARAGREYVLGRLSAQLSGDSVLDIDYQRRELTKLAKKLEPKLRKKQQKTLKHPTPFAAITRHYLHDTYAQLQADLQVLEHPDAARQQDALHHARLSGKRLRYLIEPLTDLDGSDDLLKRLKGLQDALGHIHDMYVLEQSLKQHLEQVALEWSKTLLVSSKDPRPVLCYDLAALTRYVTGRLHAAVRDLQKIWHNEKAALETGFARLEQHLDAISKKNTLTM
jgi:CHAD domain-containing protein